jgi:putative hydrolase of the HAD superfamily
VVVRAVFFDWFNTLARYEPPREELHSKLLSEFGVTVSPRVLMPGLLAADKFYFSESVRLPWQKRPPDEQARLYLRYGEIMFEKVGLSLDKKLLSQVIRRWPELQRQMHFALFEDVIAALDSLKGDRLVIGMVTNATREAIAVREKLGLQPYLNFAITSEEAGVEKPDPGIFLLALEKAGVKASEAVHVGDQYEIDVAGARGAGIKPIMIDRYDLYPDVKDCPRIRSLSELRAYLQA